jgi:hypothetical protein
MIFPKAPKLLLAILLFSPLPAGAGDFVGNSGDGVWAGGRLIVRDLLQAGLADAYWIGPSENPHFQARLAALPPPLGDAAPALGRKLSDLETIVPGLADFLLGGLGLFNFAMVEEPLTKEPLGGGVIDFPEESRVQLATRIFRTIYIHGPSWRALATDQKAALLLHEVIASLIKPVTGPDGFALQPSLRARQITAALFSPELRRQGKSFLDNELRDDLDLPWPELRERPFVNHWKLSLRTYRPGGAPPKELDFTGGGAPAGFILEQAYALCPLLEEGGRSDPNLFRVLTGQVTQREWEPRFEEYEARFGKQLRLTIRGTLVKAAHWQTVSNQDEPGSCRSLIDEQWARFLL